MIRSPQLLVCDVESRVIEMIGGEGHEPDAGRQAVFLDVVGRRLHAGAIGAVLLVRREVLGGAVAPSAGSCNPLRKTVH